MGGRGGGSRIGGNGGGQKFQRAKKEFAEEMQKEWKFKYGRESQREIKEFMMESMQKNGINTNSDGNVVVKKTVQQKARQVAEKLVDRLEEVDKHAQREYSDIKKEVWKPIYLSDRDRAEFGKKEDLRYYLNHGDEVNGRNHVRVTSNIDKEHTRNIEAIYGKLKEDYPHHFNGFEKPNSGKEMIENINGVINSLEKSKTSKLTGSTREAAIRDIMDDLYMYSYTANGLANRKGKRSKK